MFVKLVYALTCLSVFVLTKDVNDVCITPNGEIAKCIAITECVLIRNALLNRTEGAAAFAKKSRCGNMGAVPLLCCGSIGTQTKYEPPLPCTTQNGEATSCIPVSFCPILSNALETQNKDAIVFYNNSVCGYDDKRKEDLVCCGSEAYPTRTTLLPNRTLCGNQKVDLPIHADNVTQIEEFPWIALLRYKYNTTNKDAGYQCGGTVINNRYILTAAHCIYPNQLLYLYEVRVGGWEISNYNKDQVVDLKIEYKMVHPSYNPRNGKNDIALLRLDRNIEFSNYIQPICLPVSESPDPSLNSKMTIVSWGGIENGTISDVKLKIEVPIVLRDVCDVKHPSVGGVDSSRICAGGEAGKDSCKGDSGGPLMRSSDETFSEKPIWYQEGIVSKGTHCGLFDYPAIYTRVANYMDWIIENLEDY